MSMSAPEERDANAASLHMHGDRLPADWDGALALLSDSPPAGMDDVATFDHTAASSDFCLHTKGRAFSQEEVDGLRQSDRLLDLI